MMPLFALLISLISKISLSIGRIIFFVLLVNLFLATSGHAVTYYVDATGGNDTKSGTSTATAWKTISKVNSVWSAEKFNPGDIIKFKRGETWTGETLTAAESGSAGLPITITNYASGDLPTIMRYTDTGTDWEKTRQEAIKLEGYNYITIDGIHVQNGYEGISIDGCDNIKIINSDIDGVCKSAVGTKGATNITIGESGAGNKIHTRFNEYQLPCGNDSSHPDQQLVNIGRGSHDWTIAYNEIYSDNSTVMNSAAIEIASDYKNLTTFVYNITVEYNYIHDFYGSGDDAVGYAAKGGRDVTIRFNEFKNCQRRPIYVNNNSYSHNIYSNRIHFDGGGTSYGYGILIREDNKGGVDGQYDIRIWDNHIKDTYKSGILINDLYYSGAPSVQKIDIYDNTLINCGKESSNDYPISESIPSDYTVRIVNNTIKNTKGSILAYFSKTKNRTIADNVWYDTDGSRVHFGSYGARTPAWLEANTDQFTGQESESSGPITSALPAPKFLRTY